MRRSHLPKNQESGKRSIRIKNQSIERVQNKICLSGERYDKLVRDHEIQN